MRKGQQVNHNSGTVTFFAAPCLSASFLMCYLGSGLTFKHCLFPIRIFVSHKDICPLNLFFFYTFSLDNLQTIALSQCRLYIILMTWLREGGWSMIGEARPEGAGPRLYVFLMWSSDFSSKATTSCALGFLFDFLHWNGRPLRAEAMKSSQHLEQSLTQTGISTFPYSCSFPLHVIIYFLFLFLYLIFILTASIAFEVCLPL